MQQQLARALVLIYAALISVTANAGIAEQNVRAASNKPLQMNKNSIVLCEVPRLRHVSVAAENGGGALHSHAAVAMSKQVDGAAHEMPCVTNSIVTTPEPHLFDIVANEEKPQVLVEKKRPWVRDALFDGVQNRRIYPAKVDPEGNETTITVRRTWNLFPG